MGNKCTSKFPRVRLSKSDLDIIIAKVPGFNGKKLTQTDAANYAVKKLVDNINEDDTIKRRRSQNH